MVSIFLAVAAILGWWISTHRTTETGAFAELVGVPHAAAGMAEQASNTAGAQDRAPVRANPDGRRPAPPPRSIADILDAAGNLGDEGTRRNAVRQIRVFEDARRAVAERRAMEAGMPLRLERPDGTVKELVAWDDIGPVYFITHNSNAAISTGANLLQQPPYGLDGGGIVIGMWDGGAGRPTHREFQTNRMLVKDGAAAIDHATHVGGTLAAAGITASARGMAPAATVDSYDWNNDKSEMTSRGAASPGQAGRIYLSNHSYGYIGGWYRTGSSNPAYIWYGSGTGSTSSEPRFGQYNTFARDSDSLAFNAPYYLIFRSAGNERADNPAAGQAVQLSPSNSATTTYDPAIHPAGDGGYRGGYDTISFDSVAKNVITIGSVGDAATGGQRDLSKAAMSSYSSWGPTDDGRIKPDLVANGEGVYSSRNGGDSSYGTLSGTSMATPNAAGTAALLIEEYAGLFSGGAMRSSTLKGLMIHTADDLGNPGPDYRFGWGLLNGKAAADLLRDHAENPLKIRLTEHLVTTANSNIHHEFVWDGSSPIRVTLAWTDPAGSATTTSDLRTPRLRNNLDLRLIGPDGSEHFPFVMPFVGTWTEASMSLPAATGINNTDNIEQVFLASPHASGTYRAVVTFQGTLANNQQPYSLFVSGSANEEPPPPPLTLTSVAPATALAGGTVHLELDGLALDTATAVRLTRDDHPDLSATGLQMHAGLLRCTVDLTTAHIGQWSVVVENSTETATLADAFTVVDAVFFESFDGPVSGWTSSVLVGSNSWSISANHVHSPGFSYFISAPASRTSTALQSPPIMIPANAHDLQLRFWHRFDTQARQDGGRIEFSIDGGAWFGVDDSSSGVQFASNGYNSTIATTFLSWFSSPFVGMEAWSGNSNGFIETVVNFTDNAKFAGRPLRIRWVFATNLSTASPGWNVDSISITGGGDIANQPPVITGLASSADETFTETVDEETRVYQVVPGASLGLAVTATDDDGEPSLSYSWAATGPADVGFVANASNSAKLTEAAFEAIGDYRITVTATDAGGLDTTAELWARVVPVADSLAVSPANTSLAFGSQQAFTVVALDQFNEPLASQPESIIWSTTGGGAVDSSGMFTATSAGENFTVIAEAPGGGPSGFAQVTVTPAVAVVAISALAQVFDGTPKAVVVATDPPGLAVDVRYDGFPDAPAAIGTYAVEAVVTDPNHQGGAAATLEIIGPEDPYQAWVEANFTEEQQLAGLADPDADPDGDGLANRFEFLLGFDPNDPASRLETRLGHAGDGTLLLIINRVVGGVVFNVETSTSLEAGDWQVIHSIETGENTAMLENVDVPLPAGDARRFYRVNLALPPDPVD